MTRKVPYLYEREIENDAEALLAEFAQMRDIILKPPIPIEDIVEKHLKLGLEFDDTHRLFGVPRLNYGQADILGAIFLEERRIVIDESLDPEAHPEQEGRYRYTLGHEAGGHWRLHRHLFVRDPAQRSLVGDDEPLVICRSSQEKAPIEWQADFYSSCLLMPRKLVLNAWHARFGTSEPFVFNADLDRPMWTRRGNGPRPLGSILRQLQKPAVEQVFDPIAKGFAAQFGVSVQAMRIRLEYLGLLLRDEPRQRPIAGIL